MNIKKGHIFFGVAKLPLIVLYVSFFIVQLFYNLDIANHTVETNPVSLHKNNRETVKKAAVPADRKISFRLNKRYQPQPAITCTAITIDKVICYVSSKLHVHYSRGFIPSSAPPARSLRGPPVVVA
ncbi:MAG: hypothetical protein ABJB86_04830 [Bacteroidota bacterium]